MFRSTSCSRYFDNPRRHLRNVKCIFADSAGYLRCALPVNKQVMFRSWTRPYDAVGTGCLATANRSDTAGIHGCARPVDNFRVTLFRQENCRLLVPHALRRPVSEETLAGRSGATVHLPRQHLPGLPDLRMISIHSGAAQSSIRVRSRFGPGEWCGSCIEAIRDKSSCAARGFAISGPSSADSSHWHRK